MSKRSKERAAAKKREAERRAARSGSLRKALATWPRRRLLVGTCLAMALALVGGSFASFRVSRSNKAGQAEQAQSLMSQDASSPSKEYIYLGAGGRLVATEEPAAMTPNPPTGLRVNSVSSTQVSLQWNAPASGPPPTSYVVERCANYLTKPFATVPSPTGNPPPTVFQDSSSTGLTGSGPGDTVTLPVCYLYRVRSAIGSVQSNPSNMVFATTKSFADDPAFGPPLGTPARAVHILELRNAISAVYATATGTAGISGWGSGAVTTGTQIHAVHINEMRSTNSAGNLQTALQTMGFPLPNYTTAISQFGRIRAADINDTRTGAKFGLRSN
jgi:hypothetical protein